MNVLRWGCAFHRLFKINLCSAHFNFDIINTSTVCEDVKNNLVINCSENVNEGNYVQENCSRWMHLHVCITGKMFS